MKSACFFFWLMLLIVSSTHLSAQNTAPAIMMTKWGQTIDPDHLLAEYPRPLLQRPNWLSLNGYWDLQFGDTRVTVSQTQQKPPQTFPVLVPFPIESQLSGIKMHNSVITYRKRFRIPNSWHKNHRIMLNFGASDWETTVLVNGKLLGTHRGCYDAFSFDITDALLSDADQTLMVVVQDTTDSQKSTQPLGHQSLRPQQSQHKSVTGIWQSVWLEPVPMTYIKELQISPDFDHKSIQLTTNIINPKPDLVLQAELYNGEEFLGRTFGGTDGTVILRVPPQKFQNWSPESPHLYQLSIAILENNKILDQVTSYVGMRKIEVRPSPGIGPQIFLNGEPYFLNGVIDHGVWPDGLYTAPSEAAMRNDVTVAKAFGFNMMRKSGKIEPERWFYLCDTMGMFVWQDFPAANDSSEPAAATQYETELLAAVQQHRNSPSLIAWSVHQQSANEQNSQYYANKIRQIDPTRLLCVTNGNRTQFYGDLIDLEMVPDFVPLTSELLAAAKEMPLSVGKYCGIGLFAPENSWSKTHGAAREVATTEELLADIQKTTSAIMQAMERAPISAATFYQLTDLESETNGLMTYDRELMKVPHEAISKYQMNLKRKFEHKNGLITPMR